MDGALLFLTKFSNNRAPKASMYIITKDRVNSRPRVVGVFSRDACFAA